jgi:hypothetical protein
LAAATISPSLLGSDLHRVAAFTSGFIRISCSAMSKHLSAIHTHALDFWLARASVLVIVVLQWLLMESLTLGPQWLAPAAELCLLLPLSIATAWTQDLVRKATADHHWHSVARRRRMIRWLASLMTGLISAMNLASLILLVMALLGGDPQNGKTLLLNALDIWAINVIAFALWYWTMDHGGPPARGISCRTHIDFLFPQLTMDGPEFQDWSPGFTDYLFLSYTNATAFSPTDTLPLTPRAKALMMVQSAISLLTVALVAARAVNILA